MIDYKVEEIAVELIDASGRAREDYKNLQELAHSIQTKGLMHNLVVYRLPGETKAKLLAGGRRFKALTDFLKWPKVPCRLYERYLTPFELKSIELEENLRRENLSMEEDVKLKRELHELYTTEYGEKVSRDPNAPGHSQSDTAKLLGVSHATVSMDLKLAKAMEEFPDIQWDKFKNKSEAMKCLNTISTSLDRMQKSQDIQKELGDNTCRAALMVKNYVIGDFFAKIVDCPDGYFDFIEIDPPYAIDLTKVKKGYNDPGYNKTGYNEVEESNYPAFMYNTFYQCYRKAAANSWMVCWFGPDPWFSIIREIAEKVGWHTTGMVGLWVKGKEDEEGISEANAGQTHMPTKRLANAYEMFYYMWKGDPSMAKPGRSNVFGYKPVSHTKKIHPTERPIDMMTDMLKTFAHPGANVLVPFAGSGNTLLAAMLCDMKPLGFDLTEGYRDGYIIRVQEIFS